MKRIFELITLVFEKLRKKKQPTVKAENSIVIMVNINKD